MTLRTIAIAASVIGITFTNVSIANISTTEAQAAPLTTIQLAENGQINDNIQLAAQGRHTAFIAGAITGAVVGSAVTRSRARRGYYAPAPRYRRGSYSAAQNRCARRYRSYNYRTDTFVTYSGYKKLCPYVRPWH